MPQVQAKSTQSQYHNRGTLGLLFDTWFAVLHFELQFMEDFFFKYSELQQGSS